jgi:hypothetical protein
MAMFAGAEMTDESIRAELLALIAEDERVRAELAADGSLFQGYHPRMAAVHQQNGERVAALLAAHGWLGRSLVSEDGAAAAWRIIQHAIGSPQLQRDSLPRLRAAAACGEAEPWWAAMLEDRICAFEGRRQVYGTQFDWCDDGQLGPHPPVADPAGVDARRAAVGLEPLAEKVQQVRSAMAAARPPEGLAARRREMEAWARSVGWRGDELTQASPDNTR